MMHEPKRINFASASSRLRIMSKNLKNRQRDSEYVEDEGQMQSGEK
jgi:hypothetical protein